jgi:hypothetical protein
MVDLECLGDLKDISKSQKRQRFSLDTIVEKAVVCEENVAKGR